ncbi:unnamed protein product [Rotaria sordida]|uniref:Poly [ADP-ribose] polymerase n=1 Tax=Rotaria sordida TaxID=392033 RepID=A0A818QRE3_9BILA|nr:unnamed protein product [Rotaria sordida]
MSNLSDNIISIFVNKQVLTLKDSDINLALIAQGIQCYIEEVRHHVQILSPTLFQLSFNKDNTMTIHVDPQIDICEAFLAGHCHNIVKQCDKLHICREFDHCKIPNCRYPHNFTRGQNRKIVQQINCENINCILLVKLIRMKKIFNHSETSSNTRNINISNKNLIKKDDINKQIDISYPSKNLTQQIDMEIIEMTLEVKNIIIEKKFQESENEYFRRGKIQLEQINDVEKLLASPILPIENIDIKFKRTKQIIDRTSFLLKILINNQQDKIAESRIKLYIALLVGNHISYTVIDLSTMNEQICLIQCNHNLDFDKIRQQHESKPQLQGKNISLIQIYECDTVSICYIDEHKIMKYDDIRNIIQSVRKNVFTFQLVNQYYVEVEFINVDAFKEWMSIVEKFKAKFHITVTPVINEVDDENDGESVPSSTENIPFTINKPQPVTIKLRREWSMVAAHPIFKVEFKDYIHNELGGEIEINGDEVTYIGNFPRLQRCPSNEAILVNKINNYMQKLKYQTLHDLKLHHLNILRTYSTAVAFNRIHRNDYMIAAKPHDLFELRNKLFPKTNQHFQTDRVYVSKNHPFDDSHRSPSTPLLKQETMEESTSFPLVPPISPPSIYPVTTTEGVSMFSINTFEDRLQQHLKETFNVKVIIERNIINAKTKGEKIHIMIQLTGQMNDVRSALSDLINLFSSLRTRKFDDKTDGNWTKIDEAIDVIQHHFTLNNFLCICQKISSTCVNVNYFDLTNPQFGIDEQKIEDLINNQFSLATIIFNQQSPSSKFTKEWTNLEELIRKRDDFKKDICFYNETNTLYLFGLTKLVKEFRQRFEQIKNKYVPQPCKITLSDKQLNFLRYVGKNDLNKLEKQYKVDGCDLTLSRLQQHGHFLAPPDLHTKIKESLEALAQITETKFEIKSTAFEILINNEPERLLSLVKSKCYLEKKVQTHHCNISVPTAQIVDLEDRPQQSQNAQKTNSTSINIGKSTITIEIGDLTAQAVDVIVIGSTSEFLRNAIITKAGPQVQAEFNVLNKNSQKAGVTSNGTLPCKKILFIPSKVDSSNSSFLQTSLSEFVSTAITYVSDNGYKTLAFPSVGCGKLGFDPSIIAKYMIDETHVQLINNTSNIDVSFILLPSQQNVYDAFVKHLNTIQTHSKNLSKQNPKNKTNHHSKIPYEEKIIEITLISSNTNYLTKCKNDILELSHLYLFKTRLTDKHDMIDWSQNTINQYYDYCLKQHVIPTLDFDTLSLELIGPKDAVHEAEKCFYELTTETLKQARIHAVSRGVIWSVETTPNSDTWEQYSFKLNGVIEDAYLKKLPHIDFVNDKQEKYQVVLSKMEEHHETNIRHIRRKVVDSLLPDTWEPSDQNYKRVPLQSSSKEYQDVLQKFNTTMNNQYTQIIKIERIQNERWYKQYAAHRDEYKKRYGQLDERLLFHGCLDTSANQIVQECFNRSFAGVNGVVYGCGVYFHSYANYSHSYAKPSGSGERTMFLARVLIGRTCQGNPSMKVPPAGYDTTTDGQNIFVVYHDAGAYADHLITYK